MGLRPLPFSRMVFHYANKKCTVKVIDNEYFLLAKVCPFGPWRWHSGRRILTLKLGHS
jgi:hypothetical protein